MFSSFSPFGTQQRVSEKKRKDYKRNREEKNSFLNEEGIRILIMQWINVLVGMREKKNQFILSLS
jgi:hypothetical protein